MNEVIIAAISLAATVVSICVPVCCNRDEVLSQVVDQRPQVVEQLHQVDVSGHCPMHHLKFRQVIIEIDDISE